MAVTTDGLLAANLAASMVGRSVLETAESSVERSADVMACCWAVRTVGSMDETMAAQKVARSGER